MTKFNTRVRQLNTLNTNLLLITKTDMTTKNEV